VASCGGDVEVEVLDLDGPISEIYVNGLSGLKKNEELRFVSGWWFSNIFYSLFSSLVGEMIQFD